MSTPNSLLRLLCIGIVTTTMAACSSSSSETETETDPDAEVPASPQIDTPVIPPEDTPIIPPVDAPTIPPEDTPIIPPVDAPTIPPEDTPIIPPVDTPTNPPVDTPIAPPAEPTGVISSVSIGDRVGSYILGTPPAETGSLVLNTVGDGEALSIISGGSSELEVSAEQPYTTVYVLSDDGGYFLIQLDEATTSSSLILSYSTLQVEGGRGDIGVQVADAEGAVSSQQPIALNSVVVGTGDLQVSVSWDQATDVDLYLTEPDGTTIAFFNTSSDAGGMLDLDSNPACSIDGINNENITYDGFVPPSGEYIVAVDYFSNCSITTPTNILVTVRANDTVETFSGQLTPEDANLGAPVEVVRVIVR